MNILHSLFLFFFLLCFLGYEVFHISLSFHDGIKIFVAQLCISKTEHVVTNDNKKYLLQFHMPEALVATSIDGGGVVTDDTQVFYLSQACTFRTLTTTPVHVQQSGKVACENSPGF